MSGITFTFASSNPSVATINAAGLATGAGGPTGGTTTITASSQGISASTTLTTTRPAAILTTMMPYYLWSQAGETDLNTTLANLTGYIDYAVANSCG